MTKCCVETFATMDRRIRSIRAAKLALRASPLVAFFGARPVDACVDLAIELTVDQAIERVAKMKTPEIAEAIGALDALLRSLLRDDATMHAIDHHQNDRLYRFWARLADRYG